MLADQTSAAPPQAPASEAMQAGAKAWGIELGNYDDVEDLTRCPDVALVVLDWTAACNKTEDLHSLAQNSTSSAPMSRRPPDLIHSSGGWRVHLMYWPQLSPALALSE